MPAKHPTRHQRATDEQRAARIERAEHRRRLAAQRGAAEAVYADEYGIEATFAIPVATLRTRRSRKQGPPFKKLGRSVLYHVPTVAEWVERNARDGGAA